MRKEEVKDAPNVVTDTFSIKTHHVKVLFDFGVVNSFISAKLVEALGLALVSKNSLLPIALPDRKIVRCEELFMDCPIRTNRHEFLADLYKFGLTDFDKS